MPRKFLSCTAIACFLMNSACNQSPVPLPEEDGKAAETCYFDTIKYSFQNLNAQSLIGPITYFAIVAVRNKKGPTTTIHDQASFIQNSDSEKSYIDAANAERVTQCISRFPKSQATYSVRLPDNNYEAAAICFNVSRFSTAIAKGSGIKSDEIIDKANYIAESLSHNHEIMQNIAEYYNIKSDSDGDRLANENIIHSPDNGSPYSIIKACSYRMIFFDLNSKKVRN